MPLSAFRESEFPCRQQVRWESVEEASKIAGHSDLEMIGEDTFVTPSEKMYWPGV